MNQTKTLVLIGVVVIVAAFLLGYLVHKNASTSEDVTPSASVQPTQLKISPLPTSSSMRKPRLFKVVFGGAGVSPKTLTIQRGDAVQFTNSSGVAVWPASNPHPTHSDCPGFDAQRTLQQGESYTLTFPQAKKCSYHNHLDSSNGAYQGTIIVQ